MAVGNACSGEPSTTGSTWPQVIEQPLLVSAVILRYCLDFVKIYQ